MTKESSLEHDHEFIQALGQAWTYIKSDGSFTGKEVKEFVNSLDPIIARQVLQAIIQTAWEDYGGKDLKEEPTL